MGVISLQYKSDLILSSREFEKESRDGFPRGIPPKAGGPSYQQHGSIFKNVSVILLILLIILYIDIRFFGGPCPASDPTKYYSINVALSASEFPPESFGLSNSSTKNISNGTLTVEITFGELNNPSSNATYHYPVIQEDNDTYYVAIHYDQDQFELWRTKEIEMSIRMLIVTNDTNLSSHVFWGTTNEEKIVAQVEKKELKIVTSDTLKNRTIQENNLITVGFFLNVKIIFKIHNHRAMP